MSNPNYMQKEWEGFSEAIDLNDEGVSDLQRTEMRRAFFSGGICLLLLQFVMKGLSDTGDPNDVAPSDTQMLEHVHAEFQRYALDLSAEAEAAERE